VHVGRRGFPIAAIAAAAIAVAIAAGLALDGEPYEVKALLPNAGQLVEGNEVRVGGVRVGLVERIERGPEGAKLTLSISERELVPLRRGTVAEVRASSLSGVASRYVSLHVGPASAAPLRRGATIAAESVRPAVDLDEVFNTFDESTRADLRGAIRGSARILEGRAPKAFNRALPYFADALAQSAATAEALARDRRALERLIREAAAVAGEATSRGEDLRDVVGSSQAALGQLAAERTALDSALRHLPRTLRRVNRTLSGVRPLLTQLGDAAARTRPSAVSLNAFLRELRRATAAALPQLRPLRRVIDAAGERDLIGALGAMGPLREAAVPAARSGADAIGDSLPMMAEARPYTPDLISGLFNGFGGTTTQFYDANGHYARISFQANTYSANDEGSILPLPDGPGQLADYRRNLMRRCPGAATQPLPDRSNPFLDGRADFPCAPEQTPP
jgi:phospholipid/cholesterol/gamma-HCH transport system substrate-binding protein